jgi:hypothetical protein
MKRRGRFKRFLSVLLALLTALAALPTAVAAEGATNDIAGHWAEAVMQKWIDGGSLSGYGDGVYRPDASITRAEFMALVNRMKGYGGESADAAKYGDVSPDDWYYGAVSSALAAGYITGTGDAEMSPEKFITRQEAMAIMARIERIAPADDVSVLAGTNDGESAAAWAKGYVAAAVENGLIGGSGGGVSPLARITRAETVTLLDRVGSGARVFGFAGEFGPDTGTRTVKSASVTAGGAVLKNTEVTGDLEIAASVGDGDVTLTNVKVNGDLYVNGGGANTILFGNVDVLGSLIVNKTGGNVRILATGATNVRLTILESGAILVERDLTGGGFERVEIAAGLAAGQPVVLEGQFAAVENKAADLDLTVNGRVNELISSEDLTVKGTGVIAKLTSADGAIIKNETTETANAPATATGGGSGSGGGGGGNNDNNDNNGDNDNNGNNDNNAVAVSSVSVEPAVLRVQVGQTATLTASVLPENASDRTVAWTSGDPAVASVSGGVVTGVAPGSATITATAGGRAATASVEVVAAHIGASLSKFGADDATEAFSRDVQGAEAILANGASVGVDALADAGGTNAYYAYIKGGADTDTDAAVPVVLTVTDATGAPVNDIADFALAVDPSGATVESGAYVADDSVASGSAILLLDFGVPKRYTVSVAAGADYTPLSLTLYFVPEGGKTLDGAAVTGEAVVGGALATGTVTAGGEAAASGFAYQWLRSRYADEGYEAIAGATAASYSPAEADKGHYIRLKVTGDGQTLYGEALSAAKGPVVSVTDEVFAAIEAAYLGENANANYVTKNLNLLKSLAAYPGLTVAWTADPAGVVDTDTGAVTRPADADARVALTATLAGLVTASRAFEINVLMRGVDNVEQTGTDPRFKPGYPRSYIKDGTIWAEFELTEAAQVYLLVNATNGHTETTDPQSVLNGHAGDADTPVWVDGSPVFFAAADDRVTYDTGYGFWAGGEARLDFALTDRNDRTKNIGEVVTIHYDAAAVSELDGEGPQPQDAFINAAREKIYVYFDEKINAKSGLTAADFTLGAGSVESFRIVNYSGAAVADYRGGPAASYVELSVSGMGIGDGIKLAYKGGTITDTSVNANAVTEFSDFPVRSAATLVTEAYMGNDGKTLRINVEGGPNMEEFRSKHEWNDMKDSFSVSGSRPETVNWGYSIGGSDYMLKFGAALGDNPQVAWNFASMPNWAYDTETAVTAELIGNMTGKANVTGVSYGKSAKAFTVAYADDFIIDSGGIADGFTVTIEGKPYRLRGFNAHKSWNSNGKNKFMILMDAEGNDDYLKYVAEQIEKAGGNVTLSFSLTHGEDYLHNQLMDAGGALLPAFGPQSVTFN